MGIADIKRLCAILDPERLRPFASQAPPFGRQWLAEQVGSENGVVRTQLLTQKPDVRCQSLVQPILTDLDARRDCRHELRAQIGGQPDPGWSVRNKNMMQGAARIVKAVNGACILGPSRENRASRSRVGSGAE